MSQVLTGNEITYFRMRVLLSGLGMEIGGLKRSKGRSCYSIIKDEFGLKGSKKVVYVQFLEVVEKASPPTVIRAVCSNGLSDGTKAKFKDSIKMVD